MKSPDSSGNFKPFKDLKALLEKKAIDLKSVSKSKPNKFNKSDEKKIDLRSDRIIFQEAMADVKKISKSNHAVPFLMSSLSCTTVSCSSYGIFFLEFKCLLVV